MPCTPCRLARCSLEGKYNFLDARCRCSKARTMGSSSRTSSRSRWHTCLRHNHRNLMIHSWRCMCRLYTLCKAETQVGQTSQDYMLSRARRQDPRNLHCRYSLISRRRRSRKMCPTGSPSRRSYLSHWQMCLPHIMSKILIAPASSDRSLRHNFDTALILIWA